MSQGYFVCHSCGKQVRHDTEERPCEVLDGWLMVSQWQGPGAVEHYTFCCLTCLKTWTDTQAPQVPDVFLKAFDK
ncbi:MAG: hypothetical protein R6U93_07975 [Dehalococcoidia bacterium]|jgi:hypothetical protein